jgi:hypothetical protein
MKFLNWFRKQSQPKGCVFLDGDQGLPALMAAFDRYAKGSEAYFIRQCAKENIPKAMEGRDDMQKIYLSDFKARKETTDKFIAMMIQQKIKDGYTDFTVISGDTDFVDIFKMAMIANPEMNFNFRFIIPKGSLVKESSNYTTWDDTECKLEIVRA